MANGIEKSYQVEGRECDELSSAILLLTSIKKEVRVKTCMFFFRTQCFKINTKICKYMHLVNLTNYWVNNSSATKFRIAIRYFFEYTRRC
jgi:hypothetical protein